MLNSSRISCQEEIRKMLQLHRQNMRLNALLRQFKNSDEGYLMIRYTTRQAVISALSDSRQLLKFALLSLIESLRADPIKFNFLIHDMPSPLGMSKSIVVTTAVAANTRSNPSLHPIITRTDMLKLFVYVHSLVPSSTYELETEGRGMR